ncbi:MAG: histidine decarboxylase [Verrucomicrobiota bacterium]
MAFHLPPEQTARLDGLFEQLTERRKHFIGYPCTADLDFSELFRFLDFPINNVGDPFKDGTYGLHTHEFEREVIEWFATVCNASEDSYWGYVTNGGTEGNMYGLYLARELHPGGMCYYSQDTHYSVAKILRVLKMPHIMIKSLPTGQMDLTDLKATLNIHRDVPPIIFANIGTTMREGVDDIPAIRDILSDLAIPESYIHCDCALSGMTLPFIDEAPEFDFRQRIDSLSISGHKFIGSPIPCGVVLANRNHVRQIARSIEYVGTLDTTITGSRNAVTPLFLWYAVQKWGVDGFRERVAGCLENAEFAVEKFAEIGVKAWKNPHAITVVFPRPPEAVRAKWQIAVHDEIGHLVVMPHTSREQISAFIEDYAKTPESSEQSHQRIPRSDLCATLELTP